jgi:hypothetical protein
MSAEWLSEVAALGLADTVQMPVPSGASVQMDPNGHSALPSWTGPHGPPDLATAIRLHVWSDVSQ